MKPSRFEMIAVERALELVLARARPLPAEDVPLAGLSGRFLVEDVYAAESLPVFAASAVDGYALRSADGTLPRRVLAEITAGQRSAFRVEPGTTMRIMTGAPVPHGADAVIMVEQTTEQAGVLAVQRPVSAGDNVIPVGLDVAAGQVVLRTGTPLGPPEVALLVTVGRAQASVHRAPVVGVLSTGDELVEPGESLAVGKVRDSNRYGLMAAAAEAGAAPRSLGVARDEPALQERLIVEALSACDVVLTSGGVSVGSRDLIKPILERLGTIHFGRVAMKPGKPVTFATARDKLVFGLPGFPVSSLVAFELFVRPCLLAMQGARTLTRPTVLATMEHAVLRTADRVEFQRGIVRHDSGRLLARTTGLQASSRILSLSGANALLRIPPGAGEVAAGDQVTAILIGPLEAQ